MPDSFSAGTAGTSSHYLTDVNDGIAIIDKGASNRGLLNQADVSMLPRYFTNFPNQKPGQVYSPHLDLSDVSKFFTEKANGFKNGFSDTFENLPKVPSAIRAVINDPYSVFVDGGKRMQEEQRRAFLDARNGDFRTAGAAEGKQLGSAVAGSTLGWGASKTIGLGIQSVNAVRNASMLAAEEAKAINAARIANNFETDGGFVPQFDSRTQQLQYKWQGIKPENRPVLINNLADANAGRWVQEYQSALNAKYPGLNAHFVDKHGPDIPLRPNLEQRAIDGTHPRTGITPNSVSPRKSSQFLDWLSMRNTLNEAITREARGLPRCNAGSIDKPMVKGDFYGGGGQGFRPNSQMPTAPIFNPNLSKWSVGFDKNLDVPFTTFPNW